MNPPPKQRLIHFAILGAMFLFAILVLQFRPDRPNAARTNDDELVPLVADEFFRGRVKEITHEEQTDDFGEIMLSQDAIVTMADRDAAAADIPINYAIPIRADEPTPSLSVGDRVILAKSTGPDGTYYYVSDRYRLNAIWVILACFF